MGLSHHRGDPCFRHNVVRRNRSRVAVHSRTSTVETLRPYAAVAKRSPSLLASPRPLLRQHLVSGKNDLARGGDVCKARKAVIDDFVDSDDLRVERNCFRVRFPRIANRRSCNPQFEF